MKRGPLAGAEVGRVPGLRFSWDLVGGMEWGQAEPSPGAAEGDLGR